MSDASGRKTKIWKVPSQAQKTAEKILDNFAAVCRKLANEADGIIRGVGMAIPGPFDYEHGISRMQGLNKYDAIYGIPLEMEIKVRVPKLKEAKFLFLHDIEAFALGRNVLRGRKNPVRLHRNRCGIGVCRASETGENGKRCAREWLDLSDSVPAGDFG